MTYKLVDFYADLPSFEKEIKAAKEKGEYEQKAAAFDQALVKELGGHIKESLVITGDFAKRTNEVQQACKKVMDDMATLIKAKGKSLSESDLRVLATSAGSVARHSRDLKDKSNNLYKALSHFREDWLAYSNLLRDKTLIDGFVAARKKSIDESKQVTALQNRIDEYVVRSADMLKAAERIAKVNATSGNVDPVADAKEIKTFREDVVTLVDKFKILTHKATNSLKLLSEEDAKLKRDAKELKSLESRLLNGTTEAKNARGNLKTLATKIDAFKKLSSKMVGDTKKAAAVASDTADKSLKECESLEKTLAKYEKKAEEVMKALSKLK